MHFVLRPGMCTALNQGHVACMPAALLCAGMCERLAHTTGAMNAPLGTHTHTGDSRSHWTLVHTHTSADTQHSLHHHALLMLSYQHCMPSIIEFELYCMIVPKRATSRVLHFLTAEDIGQPLQGPGCFWAASKASCLTPSFSTSVADRVCRCDEAGHWPVASYTSKFPPVSSARAWAQGRGRCTGPWTTRCCNGAGPWTRATTTPFCPCPGPS